MKFTKRTIELLETTGNRQTFFDDEITGLALRIGTTGKKTFYYTYRANKGRRAEKKWIMLGTFPLVSVEQARELVKQKAAMVLAGHDPAELIKEGKQAATMREALTLFKEEYVSKLKPKTQIQYTDIIERLVFPKLGKHLVKDIAYSPIASLHHALRATPYTANRTVAVLSKFFNWCELHGYRERNTNPVQGLAKYTEHKRLRFMSAVELESLGKGFHTLESRNAIDPTIAAAIKMLLFTGARSSEILTLKWSYVSVELAIASLPDSKTGAKTLHLPPQALAILETLPCESEYCFPGKSKGHLVNIKDSWKRLLTASGLENWRIHDLRHAFASAAASSGKSLPIIGKILGHTQAATTSRYAHLAENPVAIAVSETATQLHKALSAGAASAEGRKVLPFNKKAVNHE